MPAPSDASRRHFTSRPHRSRLLHPAMVLVSAVFLAVIAGCGGDSDSAGTTAGSDHNTVDVSFATDMIPHHAQAVEMADMALAQAQSSEVVALAGQIKAAQDPEIQTMSGWLESWGEPVPDTERMSDTDGMTGMMSQQDMAELAESEGRAFDTLWLSMMVEHHEGAITMAETELDDGQSADAKALAQDIVTAQRSEITTMNALLAADDG